MAGPARVETSEWNAPPRLWHPWLRTQPRPARMLHKRWTQLGDVVAEYDASGREVVARCPGLAQWRRTPWDIGTEEFSVCVCSHAERGKKAMAWVAKCPDCEQEVEISHALLARTVRQDEAVARADRERGGSRRPTC
jgi:hypothetical protein